MTAQPEQLILQLDPEAAFEAVFCRAHDRLRTRQPVPAFHVEFRPYSTLRSTIRLRDHRAEVKLADVLADAPPIVMEALAEILLSQIYRRRPSQEARACYLSYVYTPKVRRRVDAMRRQRGRKQLLPARGRHFDLNRIFDKLNRRFFAGQLTKPALGWSPRAAQSVLGHYDAAHDTIIISRIFDSVDTPRYLVEYLVYHEMLHIKFPVERDGHRRIIHSRAFQALEKEFPHYDQALRRLRQISRSGLRHVSLK